MAPPPRRGARLSLDTADRAALRALLERRGLRPAKEHGQHFLISPAVLDAVADAAELRAEDRVVEIGPGLGQLTLRLAARSRDVIAYEVDPRLAAALREEILRDLPNVRVVEADALAVDLLSTAPTRVVGNLPYRIASPILERVLTDDRRPPVVVAMLQQEVAERLVGVDPGYLTVFAACFARAELVRRVSPRAFHPPPRVASAIVRLRTLREPACAPYPVPPFLALASDAFRHRRKTLATSLGHEAAVSRANARDTLDEAGIAPSARPEELSFAQWRALYAALARRGLRPV